MVSVGEVHGIYTVIAETNERYHDGHKLWLIQCNVCGQSFMKPENQFTGNKTTKNCVHNNPKWGSEFRGLAKSYHDMIDRCYNPSGDDGKYYKDKGIIVCEEWINNPESFKQWSIENGWESGLSIDRIDSNKNYCPENCRWITREQNSKYKSTTRCLEVNGISRTGRDWSKELGLGINRINTYVREYGEEATKKYIAAKLENPRINVDFFKNIE